MEKIGYMFAGQGAQFAGMGARLAQVSAAANAIFKRADSVLGYSISHLCFNASLEELTPCAVCQPTIFTVSVACYEAYLEQNPDAMPVAAGGLSLGEYSAAVAAGVLSFEEALHLVAERGRLMDICCKEHPGSMMAVLGADPTIIQDICQKCDIDAANFNCPGQIVISGLQSGLERAAQMLAEEKLRAIPLTVAGAYHSRLMKPAADAFAEVLNTAVFSVPKYPFFQNVTGKATQDVNEIKENLRKQIYSSIHWEACARGMLSLSERLIECGPGSVLKNFMRRIDKNCTADVAFTEI